VVVVFLVPRNAGGMPVGEWREEQLRHLVVFVLWWLFDATWKEKKKHSTCVVGGGGSAAVVRGDAASSTCRIASIAIHFLWATFHPLKNEKTIHRPSPLQKKKR